MLAEIWVAILAPGTKKLTALRETQAICQLLRSFKICGMCAAGNASLKRIGSTNDGGYGTCTDVPKPDGALSIGINGHDAWGIAISEMYGITTYEYDCTNSKRPMCPSSKDSKCNLRFFNKCVRTSEGKPVPTHMTLTEMLQDIGLASSHNLVLKIDVEGAEWEVFKSATAAELVKFTQLIVEFHRVAYPSGQEVMQLKAMQNLLKYFTVVHTHGNNCCQNSNYGRFHIPRVLEVALVRNDLVKRSGQCVSSANPELQTPNLPTQHDLAPPVLPEKKRV